MAKFEKKKRTSKAGWLEAALSILEREGIDAVKVERIAQELNTSSTSANHRFLAGIKSFARTAGPHYGNFLSRDNYKFRDIQAE